LFYSDEIRVDSNELVLGKQFDENERNTVFLTDRYLKNLLADIEHDQLESAMQSLRSLSNPRNFNNVSPVFHRFIRQHAGLTIECEMTTNDSSENGEMAYITVLRNSELFLPHDGYGLAWRKQPEFLIRMEHETHTDEDLEKFREQYDLDPENYIGQIKDNPDL
jgi:hypothetical protein